MGVKDDLRRDARVAATDDHHCRLRASGGECSESADLDRQAVVDKRAVAVDQPLGKFHGRPFDILQWFTSGPVRDQL
jgi:hypothetical protein